MKKEFDAMMDVIEKEHDTILTIGQGECIEVHARTSEDVIRFGRCLKNGYNYRTVVIRDSDGIEHEWYFDAVVLKVVEVDA